MLARVRFFIAISILGQPILSTSDAAAQAGRPPSDSSATVLPGSPLLLPLRPDTEVSLVVRRFRAGSDSTGVLLANLTVRVMAAQNLTGSVVIESAWTPPVSTTDSLMIDATTFAPQAEAFTSPSLTFHYRYSGSEISGTLQRADSATRSIARLTGEPAFAFNELESLVRSLRFTRIQSVVVPLFSEADAVLERDTLSLVADTVVAGGRRARIVRFADPVIVQRYIVDSASRNIIRITTRQRKSGTVVDARSE